MNLSFAHLGKKYYFLDPILLISNSCHFSYSYGRITLIQTVIRLETTEEKLLQTIFILILDSRCKNINYFQTIAIRTVIFQT